MISTQYSGSVSTGMVDKGGESGSLAGNAPANEEILSELQGLLAAILGGSQGTLAGMDQQAVPQGGSPGGQSDLSQYVGTGLPTSDSQLSPTSIGNPVHAAP